jgi:hypothetical protein
MFDQTRKKGKEEGEGEERGRYRREEGEKRG